MSSLQEVWSSRRAGWIGSLVLFFAALFANTRDNRFPIGYHYDEPTKVEQAMSGSFRLNQPALMLEMARTAAKVLGATEQPQAVGEIGRWLSAGYAAATVTLLAALAGQIAGRRAAIFAALLLFPQRQIILAAHYFKEDAILLLGVAVAWAALLAFLAKPGMRRAGFLGAACGLALSAKFIGALMLIPAGVALGFVKLPAADDRRRMAICFLAMLAVAVAVLNARALLHPGIFVAGFSGQLETVEHGNGGIGGSLPNWRNFGMCFLEVTPAVLALNLFYVVQLVRRGGSLKLWLLALFPAGYAAALIFSAMGAVRYALPVTAFSAVIAALALDELFNGAAKVIMGRRTLCLAGCVALAGIACGWEVWRGAEVWRGFAHDSRRELALFLAKLPEQKASLAEDGMAQIGQAASLAVPMTVRSTNFVADLGSVEELRRQGVTHVAICQVTYRRFFEASKVTQDWARQDFERRKLFYEELKRSGVCVFAEPLGRPDILHPGLELYDIRAFPSER